MSMYLTQLKRIVLILKCYRCQAPIVEVALTRQTMRSRISEPSRTAFCAQTENSSYSDQHPMLILEIKRRLTHSVYLARRTEWMMIPFVESCFCYQVSNEFRSQYWVFPNVKTNPMPSAVATTVDMLKRSNNGMHFISAFYQVLTLIRHRIRVGEIG